MLTLNVEVWEFRLFGLLLFSITRKFRVDPDANRKLELCLKAK
jgi:hypothetical protein